MQIISVMFAFDGQYATAWKPTMATLPQLTCHDEKTSSWLVCPAADKALTNFTFTKHQNAAVLFRYQALPIEQQQQLDAERGTGY